MRRMIVWAAALLFGAAPTAELRVARLRCEYRVDPLGIDVRRPRLSWVLLSGERAQIQTAYQVLCARSLEALDRDRGDLWDSGQVASDRSVHVVYGGEPLRSGERAWWKVRVWDKDGLPSGWSSLAWWEAGLLRAEDWKARWIGLRPRDPEPAPLDTKALRWIWFPEGNPAASAPKGQRYFRKRFELPAGARIQRADFYLTADNRFTLFVNGKNAGQGSAWTRLEKIDVKEALAPGANVLAVQAGNEDGAAGLVGQLRIELEEGAPVVVSTDKAWKALAARPAQWQAAAFDDAAWPAAQEVAAFGEGPWAGLSEKNVGAAPALPCPFLRKSFVLERPVARARLYATALGLYEVTLNGRRVGADRLTPGWTDYHKRLQVQAYDVTGLLQPGENVLGAILGDGWFAGKIGWLPRDHKTYGPGPARLLLQLVLDAPDGGRHVIATDDSWKAAHGPILESDLLDGETYDARLEMPGWNRPGFSDAAWSPADVFEEKSPRNLVGSVDGAVQATQELKTVALTEPRPGVHVFDLGQNMVGWARLRVRGPAGTAVTLRFAEVLNPDGTVYTANLRKAKCTDRYILRGGGEEVWEPRFTFHGFRYVELTGYPGKPKPDAVTGIVAHSATPPAGSFECSNPMLNQLQRNIVWGQRGNFLSIPTDCPQRDERLGWMGDAQIFIRTACWNMDVAAFFTKWCRDIGDAQSADGAFPDVAPRLTGILPMDGSPAWGDAGIICPWTIYLCYGDTRILEEHYPAFVRWVEHVRKANPDLLWTKRAGNNYGDWVSIGSKTDKGVLATAYFALSARRVSKIARVLGKEEDSRKYEGLFQQIRAAFNKAYVDAEGKIKSHEQTCYILALRFDLLPEELRPRAVEHLVADIEKRGGHLSTGFLGVGHLLPALSENGRPDAAYRLLLNETFPSWGYSIKHGATTIWERWDGWTQEKGFQDPGMNSFNHYAFGSAGEWMYANIAGIDLDPEKPGYKHILIRPRPGGEITRARGELESMYGTISSDWKIEGRSFRLRVTIPVNAAASVTLPSAKNASRDGKAVGAWPDRIGSGTYEYAAELE